ncbi:MAG: aspartate aminotransferase family protein [Deltaproteobacteria bacterium]|nr:aspartate aminotransferase family protein [Deltaproteobacteria bacterium]
MSTGRIRIPASGIPADELLARMQDMRDEDADWKSGRTFSLVYFAGERHTELLKKAYTMFFSENALNPNAFPSLRQFENEVVAMTGAMLGGDENVAGTMTTGGTESILMAMKTYRQWARATKPGITKPEVLLPLTAHPAFEKACAYFDLKAVHAPINSDFQADVKEMEKLITKNTIVMVGSAVAYPHGVVDPIPELAGLAKKRDIGFHVDGCLGGFMLPWLKKLGYPIPDFDLSVPGVTSISADIHKYGYASKGTSVILYCDQDLRRHQFFTYSSWPGGIYASPSMAGTRAGGAIATAWAAMMGMGEDGYMRLQKKTMETARALMAGINDMDELYILGKPVMTVFAFASDTLDVFALADAMARRGWHLNHLQFPACLHMIVSAAHAGVVEPFLSDMRESVAEVKANPQSSQEGSAAMYGMLASIPERSTVDEYVVNALDRQFTYTPKVSKEKERNS